MKFLSSIFLFVLGTLSVSAHTIVLANPGTEVALVTLKVGGSSGTLVGSFSVSAGNTVVLSQLPLVDYFVADYYLWTSGTAVHEFSLSGTLSTSTDTAALQLFQSTTTSGAYGVGYFNAPTAPVVSVTSTDDLTDASAQLAWKGFTAGFLLLCVPGVIYIGYHVLNKGIRLTNQ